MAVTFTQLTHFIAVARAGSFSGAARALGVAQPAVSQSIAVLEQDLDVKLLFRTSRLCRLTAPGEEFLVDAERVVKDMESARQRVRRAAGRGEHRVVLGMTGGLSSLLTERLLNETKSADDRQDLVIMEGSVGRLRELLLEGRIDCALTYNVGEDDPQLKAKRVAYEPMHLTAHPEVMDRYLLPGPVDLRQIARFPLFLPSITREAGAGRLLLTEAQRHGIALDVRYELQSTTIVRRLLMQDRLATVIGLGTVADDIAVGALSARVVEMAAFCRSVSLAVLAARPFGPSETMLLARVRRIAADFLLPCGIWRADANDFTLPDYELFRKLR